MNRQYIHIPEKLKLILKEADLGIINGCASKFGKIYEDNRLYFFPEYTNHGITHIEEVLIATSELISADSYNYLESKDITILILSVILHDLGMHIAKEPLIRLIENDDLSIIIPGLDKKSWKEEWQEFFHQAKRFNEVTLEQIFGDKNVKIIDYDFEKNESYSKKLLGEFLRRMHPRLAHEIAIKGYPTSDPDIYQNLSEDLDPPLKDLAGLVARSHGLELRDTFNYLEDLYYKAWASPYNIKIIYLMTILRIADYIQIHKDRAHKLILQTRRLSSPLSVQEWEKHSAIEFINTETDDPERIYVQASPKTSNIFLELQKLFKNIQYELDISWAVLGEVYGRHHDFKKLGLSFRRIQSNLDEKDKFQKSVNYIPEKVAFDADPEILKLLIGPLYGEDPKYGIRELLQNSVDATKERIYLEKEKISTYEPQIQIEIKDITNGDFLLILIDNGVGMSKDTLINYFFRAGASFRKSDFWLKQYGADGMPKIERVGRFGVGVLAAYLLGDEIAVTTRYAHAADGLFFTAKLTSRQIELNKIQCAIGTRIEIKLKNEIIKLLNESKEREIEWFTWYKLNHPEINLKIDPKLLDKFQFNREIDFIPDSDDKNNKWRSFQSAYGKVKWSISEYETDEERYADEQTGSLRINGFDIPDGYFLSDQKYNWKLPIVSVFDINGTMPLSLNRNYLQNNLLPFENDLIDNICRDVIARILSLDINQWGSFYMLSQKTSTLDYINSVHLNSNIVFIKDNYTLGYPSIMYKLGIDSIPLIWIKKTKPNSPTDVFKNGYISIPDELNSISSYNIAMDNNNGNSDINKWFSVLGSESRRAIAWKRIFLKQEKYKYLSQGKRIRLGFKNGSKKDSKSKHWLSLIYKVERPYYTDDIQPQEKLNISESSLNIEELDLLESEIDLVVEHKFGYYEDRFNYRLDNIDDKPKEFVVEKISQFAIFEKMLTEYIGPDFLIPINLEERKRKFGIAFKELENEISFYDSLKT